MAELQNKSGAVLSLFAAEGPDVMTVDPDGVIKVPGEANEVGDAYLIGDGDNARAWPMAVWELVRGKQPAKQADDSKEK